ncbi:MAG: M48 family metallopeptidase [Terriglobales bacterium]
MVTSETIPVLADSPESRRYNRVKRWLGIADFAIGFGLLVVLLASGWTRTLRDVAERGASQNYVFAVFLYVLMLMLISQLIGIPVAYYSFRLEHRYNLSNQRFGSWLWDEFKSLLLGLVMATIVVELLYMLIRQTPQHWWIIAWIVFLGLVILLAQIAPVVLFPIFYKFEPLENEELKRRLIVLSERAGTHVRGVYKWHLSEKSKKANAALTGLGATRRIILADTLLDHYSDDEIEAVLAHELGHHVHRHILKSIFVQAGITLFGFWLADQVLTYAVYRRQMFETMHDFANLPLLILVATGLSFLLMPALNAYSRFNERQADRYCFQSVASVEPFISSMNKLAEQNLSEKTPARWVEWLLHSHPAIVKRVAAAEAWAKSH